MAFTSLVRLLCGLSLAGGCHRQPPAAAADGALRRVIFDTPSGPCAFCLEPAMSEAAHSRGLMYRRRLPADGGMLFVFPHAMPRQFWMRNTYMPLDMIFVGTDLRVVGIVANAPPLSEQPRGPAAPCHYVVEVAGGTAQRNHIQVGTQMHLGAACAPVRRP